MTSGITGDEVRAITSSAKLKREREEKELEEERNRIQEREEKEQRKQKEINDLRLMQEARACEDEWQFPIILRKIEQAASEGKSKITVRTGPVHGQDLRLQIVCHRSIMNRLEAAPYNFRTTEKSTNSTGGPLQTWSWPGKWYLAHEWTISW